MFHQGRRFFNVRLLSATFFSSLASSFVATAAVAAATQSTDTPPALTPFMTIVSAHFQDWDRDKNGTLDEAELNQLIADPSITGDQAVAVADIKILMNERKHFKIDAPPFTMDYFNRYQSEGWFKRPPPGDGNLAITPTPSDGPNGNPASAAPSLTDSEKRAMLEPNFDRQFRMLKVKLGRVKYVLFTDAEPSQDVIHQGLMGDCFYLSSLGAMVERDPTLLHRMIVPGGSGASAHYTVTFPGNDAVTIPAPTDSELAIGAGSAGNGLWLPVMEKAFGALLASRLPPDQRPLELLDLIGHGGDPDVAISMLTGHTTDLTPALHEHTQSAEQFLPGFREKLIRALAEHRLVVVSCPAGKVPPGMVPQHSYAATGYDPATDQIQIWNPLGRDFSPKGPEGITNGYETTHGHFSMPLTDFYRIYRSAIFETADAAKMPSATQPS